MESLELFEASIEGVNQPYWIIWSLDGPVVYAGIVVTLTLVGFFATLRPLRRALSLDPVVALRA